MPMVMGKPRITFSYNPADSQPPTHYEMRSSMMMSNYKPESVSTTQYQSNQRPFSQGYENVHDVSPISNFLLSETKTTPQVNLTA